jgi:superfamily II DNA or RNA helicase
MTPEYSKLLERNDFSHIIGLTATPDITARGKEFKKELFDTLCPIIFSFTDAENHGIVNKAKIIAIDHYLTDEFKVKAGSKIKPFFLGELQQYSYICSQLDKGQRLMASVGSQDFFEDAREWFWEGQGDPKQMTAGRIYLSAIRMRTEFLLNLPSTAKVTVKLAKRLLESQDNKILIFAERIAQIDKMCTYSVHSKNKPEVNDTNLKMFNQGMVRTLGSAYSLTLGLNMKAANVAIFESFQGSETKAVQRKGRLHRLPIDELATMYVIRVKDTRAEKWFNATFDKDEISEVIESKDILQ